MQHQPSFDEMVSKAFNISSFTVVGHLLHINLRDQLLQYKNEIGKSLLARHKTALAVVNKVTTIDNTYRNFDIEVIAKREGCTLSDEELMICEVKENKCRFKLDFSKVYWNSRLSTEHERIIKKLNVLHDIVFDVFAGIGPFSVPAAKSKCKAYSNDLNPESFKWLQLNMKRNKVDESMYELFNKDGKDFILDDIKQKLIEEYKRVEEEELATKPKIHIIMNLPALAPTFLPHFRGLLATLGNVKAYAQKSVLDLFREQSLEHVIYCYLFLKGSYEDPKAVSRQIVEENFGRKFDDDQILDISRVRNVAPFKDMYRVDIKLDEDILFETKERVIDMTNGHAPIKSCLKKVTISEEPRAMKRPHDYSSNNNSIDESIDSKRARVTDYCTVI